MQKMKDGRVIFSAAEVAAMRTVLDNSITVVDTMNADEHKGKALPEVALLEALEHCIGLGVTVEGLEPLKLQEHNG